MDRLTDLFTWAVTQADAALTLAPLAIHQASMPRDHTGLKCHICSNGVTCIHKGQIIKARPFTVAFEKYVDHDETESPIVKALAAIHSDPSLGLEFEIAWAVVEGGHTDLETLRAILGRPNGFEAAATRGLGLLRDKTTLIVQKRVSETGQRRENAGQAQQARAEDHPKIDTRTRKRRAIA